MRIRNGTSSGTHQRQGDDLDGLEELLGFTSNNGAHALN